MLDRFRCRPDTARMRVPCVAGILAGGVSRRLGEPKALLELADGRTMLEHVAAAAASVAAEVVILGEPPGVPERLSGLRVLPDRVAGRGPLAGLCSLLECAAPHWGLLLACDLPRLEVSVLNTLLQTAAGQQHADAVAFVSAEDSARYEACCAAYHSRLHGTVIQYLNEDAGSLQTLLHRVRTVPLTPSRSDAAALFDVDTADDLRRLREAAS